jgi:hypothetical protein
MNRKQVALDIARLMTPKARRFNSLWYASRTFMGYLRAAVAVQFILALYFQVILWFPLGAWNNQPGERLLAVVRSGDGAFAAFAFAFGMLLPSLLFLLAYCMRWIWLIWLGLLGNVVWGVMQLQSWWIPYLFGADARALQNQAFLKRTYKILPSSPNHPAPDAMHLVLDALLCFVVIFTLAGLLKIRRKAVLHESVDGA